jgi:endonuclease/exonuclease/phosphatase family metal-dependent hydrolase
LTAGRRAADNGGKEGVGMQVMTWNIQWGKGCDGRVDLRRIVDAALALGDADVLCFQEVAANYPLLDGGRGEDQPRVLHRRLGDRTMVFLPAIDVAVGKGAVGGGPERRRFGNIVFSRLPVLQVISYPLPRPAEPGAKSMQRHAVEVVVEAPSGPLRVVTTHLEYYSARHRELQVERLRALHREAAERAGLGERRGSEEGPYETVPRPAAAVLCGDFNFEPGWPDYEAMLAPFVDGVPGFRDAWTVAHPGEPHAPTCGIHDVAQWRNGPNCRDFFFVTEDLAGRVRRLEVDPATDASDHQPVLLELE